MGSQEVTVSGGVTRGHRVRRGHGVTRGHGVRRGHRVRRGHKRSRGQKGSRGQGSKVTLELRVRKMPSKVLPLRTRTAHVEPCGCGAAP